MGGAFRWDHNGRAGEPMQRFSGSLLLSENSLFRRISSLFRRKFSMFDRVGNSIKKGKLRGADSSILSATSRDSCTWNWTWRARRGVISAKARATLSGVSESGPVSGSVRSARSERLSRGPQFRISRAAGCAFLWPPCWQPQRAILKGSELLGLRLARGPQWLLSR